jgi:hypothetical protein
MLATPELGGLPYVISGLVAAGGLAAALSTADGLLLTISNALDLPSRSLQGYNNRLCLATPPQALIQLDQPSLTQWVAFNLKECLCVITKSF